MILHEEGRTESQQATAHDLMTLLTLAYPDHPWAVKVDTNLVFIRYLDPLWEATFKGPVGVVIKLKTAYSASSIKRDVINAGGQLLEMMNLKRGRSNGDEPESIEGVPTQFHKRTVEAPKVIVDATGGPLRTQPRPQVM